MPRFWCCCSLKKHATSNVEIKSKLSTAMTLRNNVTTTSQSSLSQPPHHHQRQHLSQQNYQHPQQSSQHGQHFVSSVGSTSVMTSTANIKNSTLPLPGDCGIGNNYNPTTTSAPTAIFADGTSSPSCGTTTNASGFYFRGNNFSNENYTDSTYFNKFFLNSDSGGGVHHPHYQNHNPKKYSQSAYHQPHNPQHQQNKSSSTAMLSLNSSNCSSTHDQMAIYEEIPDGDRKCSPEVLSDLTKLSNEERYQLEDIRMKRDLLRKEIESLREQIDLVKNQLGRGDSVSTGDISSLGGGASSTSLKGDSEGNRLKKLQIGKKKFNMDPKKGIEFLFENGVLDNTPQDVAAFLFKGEGLTKMSIGIYLGEKIDFNLAVLDAFVELHNFQNLHLVQALRQFLYSFRLPGEAQKIDRIMEKFAARYCQHNEGVFNSSDTCFVLSFSVIMLNTTLHNPNVKIRMNADGFVNMNRGINNGEDLPRQLLLDLYESIRTEPFKMPEDDGLMQTFFNPDREGWLWKQGGRYKNWKRRWFLLNDKCLYYFEHTNDKEPRGIIPLENIDVRDVSDRTSKQNCIELYSTTSDVIKACKTDAEGRVIEGRHTVYRLSAGSPQEKEAWLQSLQASVSKSPFYEMLAARKRKAQHN